MTGEDVHGDPSTRSGYPRPVRCLALVLAVGCGGSTPAPGVDAAPPDADTGPPDLGAATWQLERVAETPGDSQSPAVAMISDGRVLVAWQESNSIQLAIEAEEGWDLRAITVAGATGHFGVQATADDNRGVDLVFAASLDASSADIHHVFFNGATLSATRNLTPGQTEQRLDASPTLVHRSDGTRQVYYNSNIEGQGGTRELRRVAFIDPNNPAPPVVDLPGSRNCGETRALMLGDTLHAVTKCIPNTGEFEVVYLTDRSGVLTPQVVDEGDTRAMLSPDLAVVPGSGTLHVAFSGLLDCPSGLCREVYHSLNLSVASPMTGTPDEDWRQPRIILDRFDRLIAVFHTGDSDRLHWTFLGDTGFFRTQRVDPNDGFTGVNASFGVIDPSTGLPVFAFERSEGGAPADIWIARLVP